MRCQATTVSGQPCKKYAMRGKTYCNRHKPAAATLHGFYARTYTAKEIADLVALADETSLDDELGASRVAIRRLITYLNENGEGIDPKHYASLANLVFTGSNTIAKLIRTKHLLAQSGELGSAIGEALTILSDEWQLDI